MRRALLLLLRLAFLLAGASSWELLFSTLALELRKRHRRNRILNKARRDEQSACVSVSAMRCRDACVGGGKGKAMQKIKGGGGCGDDDDVSSKGQLRIWVVHITDLSSCQDYSTTG